MIDIYTKLLGGLFLFVGLIAGLVGYGIKKKGEGKLEAQAEATESELEAMRDRDDYIEEIESNNRTISDDELYDGLRSLADKDSD